MYGRPIYTQRKDVKNTCTESWLISETCCTKAELIDW